jgi:hypothetical protein
VRTRAELLAAEDAAWRELWATLARLRQEDWERPGAAGAWTPKDVLAHIACWHAEAVRVLEGVRAGTTTRWPEVEAFNRDAHDRCRHLALKEVLAMAGAARHRFREEVAATSEEELTPELLEALASCAHGHYAEHLPGLDALARTPA